MRKVLGFVLGAALLSAACGGHSGSPTSPSTSDGSSSASAATISGTVQGGGVSALTSASSGAALAGVTVTVVGTSISSGVDAAGRFTLTNVPPGSVQLRISGGGTDATVTLTPVQAAQSVEIKIVVNGNNASVESELRKGGGESELEGRVESLPPTTAALTFVVSGRTVKTDASTAFVDGSLTRTFADLRIGMRVHVKGQTAGDTFTAAKVEMQNSNTASPVEVNGVIDTVTGDATSFQFKIGSRVIRGDSTTSFSGAGPSSSGFTALKDGVRVEVKGEQRDGFVFAIRIHVNGNDDNDDDDDDDADDDGDDHGQDDAREVKMEGSLSGLGGACPAITFSIGTVTFQTSASTRFDDVSCSSLKNGDKVEAKGTRRADGSVVDAERVKKAR